jgi:hypothetical protein
MDVYVMEYGCVCDISCACVDIYVISLFVLMESKKQKKHFSSLCRVPHSTKRALPSAMTVALGKAGKQRLNFLALPSARADGFFGVCSLPSVALGKAFAK